MLNDPLSIDKALAILNELVQLDPSVAKALIDTRYDCNEKIADHPSFQVHCSENQTCLGFLGVLNGLFGTLEGGPRKGWGPICAVFEDDGSLIRFERTTNS